MIQFLLSLAFAQDPVATGPEWIERVAPEYPAAAVGLGDASCRVVLHIDEAGRFADIGYVDCAEPLREAARQAGQASSWKPATNGTVAVASQIELIYKFKASAAPAPTPAEAIRLSHEDIQWKNRAIPNYPEAAIPSGYLDVECRVRLFVDEMGQLTHLEFVSCPEVFQEAARDAAQRSAWWPAKVDGVPTKAQFLLVYRFAKPSGSLGPPSRTVQARGSGSPANDGGASRTTLPAATS